MYNIIFRTKIFRVINYDNFTLELNNIHPLSPKKKKKKIKSIHWEMSGVVGLFRNCRLGCLLPRYGPMVLGRRVRISLTATHSKPACAQARAHLLRPWTRAHGRWNCYKKFMAGMCNMTIIRRICLLSTRKTENTKSWS